MSTALIILAAGQGTRMNSERPKVLHELAGVPLFAHALRAGTALGPERVVLVTGHGGADVEKAARALDPDITTARQAEQNGTAHAVAQAQAALDGFAGDVLVLYGDTPFLTPKTLEKMQQARARADLVMLGFEASDPGRYGRMVVEGDRLERIVEYKDANAAERAITLCNSGVLMAPAALLFELVAAVKNDNAAGEYYLTDIVAIAAARDLRAMVVTCDEAETLGINTRAELAAAEAAFQARARSAALDNGVAMAAPDSVIFALDTMVGRDATIEPYVVFGPGVTVETGARIRAFSHLEDAHVSRGAVVGPYGRLRPGTVLEEGAKVGNFVEIKNAQISAGAKVNHLSYVGDAFVGKAANIGAGSVTCNYDGVMKHHTHIGAGAFIGTGTYLVAPVSVGDDAMTATGTVVTQNVDDGAMAIARSEMLIKPGLARRLFEKLNARKKKQQESQ